MSEVNKTEAGQQWENLQMARSRLRYMSHRYVGCKNKDDFTKERAADELEKAALAFALASAIWGQTADCAKPAGKAGDDWKKSLEPEELLKSEELRYTAEVVSKDPSFKKHLAKVQRTGGRGR